MSRGRRRRQAADEDRRPVPLQARHRPADQPRRQARSSTSSARSTWPPTRSSSSLWLAATDGKSEPRQLTNAAGKKDRHPRWSPDGKQILFESNRSGDNQLWVIDLDGGEARQLTHDQHRGRQRPLVAATARQIAFVSAVYPEYSRQAVQGERRAEQEEARRRSRRTRSRRRSSRSSSTATGTTTSRTSGSTCSSCQRRQRRRAEGRHARRPRRLSRPPTPSRPATISPSARTANIWSSRRVPEKDEAWSTNYDICRVPVTGGKTKWEIADEGQQGGGQRAGVLAGRQEAGVSRRRSRPGFEADKWDLMVVDVDPSGAFEGQAAERHRAARRFVGSISSGTADGRDLLHAPTTRPEHRSIVPLDRRTRATTYRHCSATNGNSSLSLSQRRRASAPSPTRR